MATWQLLFTVLVIALVSASAEDPPNDLIIGSFDPTSTLLLREKVEMEESVVGLKVTRQKTFTVKGFSKITQVKALDQHTNGHGATASRLAGGVGFDYVTLRFESERFRSINFIVELYGK